MSLSYSLFSLPSKLAETIVNQSLTPRFSLGAGKPFKHKLLGFSNSTGDYIWRDINFQLRLRIGHHFFHLKVQIAPVILSGYSPYFGSI